MVKRQATLPVTWSKASKKKRGKVQEPRVRATQDRKRTTAGYFRSWCASGRQLWVHRAYSAIYFL